MLFRSTGMVNKMTDQKTSTAINRPITIANLRPIVFKRDRYTCQYCGDKTPPQKSKFGKIIGGKDPVIEHINGKSNDMSNVCTSCRSCNSIKRSRNIFQFLDYEINKDSHRVSYIIGVILKFGFKRSDFNVR